jgi:hypothetical protein
MDPDLFIEKINGLKAARIQASKILDLVTCAGLNGASVIVHNFYACDDPKGPHIDIRDFLTRHKHLLVEAAEKELQEIDKKCDKLESVLNEVLASVDLNV